MPVAAEDVSESVVLSASQMDRVSGAKENIIRQRSEGCPRHVHDGIGQWKPLPIAVVAVFLEDLQHAVHFIRRESSFSQMTMDGGEEFNACVCCRHAPVGVGNKLTDFG